MTFLHPSPPVQASTGNYLLINNLLIVAADLQKDAIKPTASSHTNVGDFFSDPPPANADPNDNSSSHGDEPSL